jgi:TolB-like protein/DNA-binding SARP family transcriptional activator/Tfp pilus assembly protein PilF
MIEITLLGRVALAVDGRPVGGEAGQRKRLAVVALLALPPLRPVSRDRLVAYLWPERDADAARHLLSAAVHVLRKVLGADALLSNGDELALEPARVRVDVADFEAAIAAADWEAALALYGGPFLGDFNPGGSAELDRWIDGARERLERLHAEALQQLAEQRTGVGDVAGAVELWRRRAALDPYASAGALGLMRALAAAGNRGGAIQHARIHAQLLESEFNADPDPAVAALAEALKEGPPEPAATDVATGVAPDPAPEAGVVPAPAAPDAAPQAAIGPAPANPATSATSAAPAPPASAAAALPARRRPRRSWWSRPARPPSRRSVALAAAATVAVAGATVAVLAVGRGAPAADDAPPPTVAVLPFNLPAGAEAERYLGDGIAEQVLDQLGTVSRIRVVARASSFAYAGRSVDVREVGRALGATAVVEGSVARSDGAVRVWVQLVDARTGYRIWSQTYDRPAGELFALQDEIARSVAGALHVRLHPAVATPPRSTSVEAFDLYLQGRHAWLRRTTESLEAARALFARAVAADSGYARAWVGLADAYNMLGSYDYAGLPPTEAYVPARAAALRALRLEPELASAHASLATIHMNYDWNWAAAEREFRRALELNPGYAQARQWFALFLAAQERFDEAAQELRTAAELDPASPLMLTTRSHFFFYTRDWDRPRAESEAALRLDPGFSRAHVLVALLDLRTGEPAAAAARLERLLAAGGPEPVLVALLSYAHAAAGRTAAARAGLDALRAEARHRYVPHEALAVAWLGLGDLERAIDSLERAFDARSSGVLYLPIEPLVDPLRAHPRFQRLLARRPA